MSSPFSVIKHYILKNKIKIFENIKEFLKCVAFLCLYLNGTHFFPKTAQAELILGKSPKIETLKTSKRNSGKSNISCFIFKSYRGK